MDPHAPAPTTFRIAVRYPIRNTRLEWASPEHPANGLLGAMSATPVNLAAVWDWLTLFNVNDVTFFSRGMARTVSGTADITCERVRLTSHCGDQVSICHAPNAKLSTRDLAALGTVVMLVTGGLGQTAEELDELHANEVEEQAVQEAAVKDELSAEGAKALRSLMDALTTCVAPSAAQLSLHPLRRDEPADLVLGDCTLRVYDRNSHMLARFLLQLGQTLRAGVQAVVAQGRP